MEQPSGIRVPRKIGAEPATTADGKELAAEMIASVRARDTFRKVIRLQQGDPTNVNDPSWLPAARHEVRVISPRFGSVTALRCEQVDVASVMLGGGHQKKTAAIDPTAGLVLSKKMGDVVEVGETHCTAHNNLDSRLGEAMALLKNPFEIGPAKPQTSLLLRKVIGATDT